MAANFTAVTSRLGVHVDSTSHDTQHAAEDAAREAIHSGDADSAAVLVKDDSAYGSHVVSYLGSGR